MPYDLKTRLSDTTPNHIYVRLSIEDNYIRWPEKKRIGLKMLVDLKLSILMIKYFTHVLLKVFSATM